MKEKKTEFNFILISLVPKYGLNMFGGVVAINITT